jgi:alpha-N-acetylglucosamine transferase
MTLPTRAPSCARTCAYVTLVTNADFAIGATVLLRSLALTGTTADRVVMHGPDLAPADRDVLEAAGARLVPVDPLPLSPEFLARHAKGRIHAVSPFTKGQKPAFHTPLDNFAKLRLWRLPYDRVIFLDADTLVLRNIDRLFHYPEFSAAPNVYETVADFRRMNSGVFTARPSEATFQAMLDRLDQPGAFWPRTDQTFLQAFFPRWQGLPVYDNMLQYVWLNLPELWDWSLINVLHFQYEKPWDPDNAKIDRLGPLVDLWRAFRDGEALPDLDALALPPCASF